MRNLLPWDRWPWACKWPMQMGLRRLERILRLFQHDCLPQLGQVFARRILWKQNQGVLAHKLNRERLIAVQLGVRPHQSTSLARRGRLFLNGPANYQCWVLQNSLWIATAQRVRYLADQRESSRVLQNHLSLARARPEHHHDRKVNIQRARVAWRCRRSFRCSVGHRNCLPRSNYSLCGKSGCSIALDQAARRQWFGERQSYFKSRCLLWSIIKTGISTLYLFRL